MSDKLSFDNYERVKMKRILIASRWYAPIKNPRAFRTYELLVEFISRGYNVTAFLPEDAQIQENAYHMAVPYGNMGSSVARVKATKDTWQARGIQLVKRLFMFVLGDGPKNVRYSYALYKKLKNHLHQNNDYNVILSISYPFYVNVALACLKRYINPATVLIADCGDPFYANPSFKKAFYLKYLEKWVLNQFDYVTIPIEAARSNYLEYLPPEKIKVIPQGFKLMDIPASTYQKNTVPTFGYAGVFYESIRNPRYFFEYLLTLQQDFRFVVYAIADGFTARLLAEYKEKLGDKLDIREAVDREVLIPEMATWEFVINFDNDNSNQRPSKLIDYAMSKRPILSFNQASFKPDVFSSFLSGDYREREHIDLSQYDIRTVVDKFEELFNKPEKRGAVVNEIG